MPTQFAGLPTKTVRELLSAGPQTGLGAYKRGSKLQNGNRIVSLVGLIGLLEGFPLMHQVTDFPHQLMMPGDGRFGS